MQVITFKEDAFDDRMAGEKAQTKVNQNPRNFFFKTFYPFLTYKKHSQFHLTTGNGSKDGKELEHLFSSEFLLLD